MEFLYNGNILVVNLTEQKAEEDFLPEEVISNCLGGARANLELLDRYPEMNVAIGSGPFTATPVPGACLAVATWKRADKISHIPLNLFFGMEFKLSGFDFVLLGGVSPEPLYLWLHDGIADLITFPGLSKDTWEATDSLRRELGEDLVQVLLNGKGPALNLGYWSSADREGLGRYLSSCGLRAVCCRGLGMLDVADPQSYISTCLRLQDQVRDSLPPDVHGLDGILSLYKGESFHYSASLIHRRRACFACPYDCNTFLKIDEDPGQMGLAGVEEPGVLLTDALSLHIMEEKGIDIREGAALLRRAARLGAFPDGAAALGPDAGDEQLISAEPAGWPEEAPPSPFSDWCPPRLLGAKEGDWVEAQAMAYTLGICPLLVSLSPAFHPSTLSQLLREGAELEVPPDHLIGVCKEVLSWRAG